MARGFGGLTTWPLWAVEGMAQYLSIGAGDREAAMWLRDAVRFDLLPKRASQAAREFSPYRYGSAMWAYLAGRFGDRVMAEVLGAGAGTFEKRLHKVTGVELEQLFSDWRAAAYDTYRSQPADGPGDDPSPLLREAKAGRMQLGPSLSPDGRRASLLFRTGSAFARPLPRRHVDGRHHAQAGHDDGHGAVRKPAADSIRRLVESGRRSVRLCRHRARPACPRHSGYVTGLAAIGRSSFRNWDRS